MLSEGPDLSLIGARCVATLLHEMKRRGKDCRYGVISMCIGSVSLSLVYKNIDNTQTIANVNYGSYNANTGTGMGAAAVFERGDRTDELCNARKVDSLNFLSKDAR